MHVLRRATHLVRLMLAWFVLSLGAAIASPAVHAGGLQLVCTGSGAIKFVPAGESAPAGAGHTLDCPLCASVSAPPSTAEAAGLQVLAHFTPDAPAPAATTPRQVVLPPSRGPPARF